MDQQTLSAAEFSSALLTRLAAAPDPAGDPASMADLFRLAYERAPQADALRSSLLIDGLRRTLAHATRTTPFYRERSVYRALLEESDWMSPPDLSGLPVLNRRDLSAAPEEFLAEGLDSAWLSHTAGSTGTPVSIHRAPEEVRFVQDYFRRMMDRIACQLTLRPLVLTFPNVYHGVPTPLPSVGKVFSAGVTDDVLIADAARVLGARYSFPGHEERISILSGLGFHIAFFTSWLVEHDIDPRAYNVRSINITGAFASRSLRRFLAETWGAAVFDRFTLTEVVGGATRTGLEEPFQMDPYVLAEVVDADQHRPISEGVGLLVMTSLHPFSQRQPIIRYATGDLVRIRSHNGFTVLAFDFLGKTNNCVAMRDGGRSCWLLYSAELNEVLGEHPDVRLYEWFSNVRTAFDRTVGNQPLFKSQLTPRDGEPPLLSIEIELRYAPHCFPDRVKTLQANVAAALRKSNPALDRLVSENRLELRIRFLSPGALGDAVRFKI